MAIKLHLGNSLDIMKEMIKNKEQVDSIITDPPYTLQETYFGSGEGTGGFLSNNKANKESINKKIGFDTNMSYGDWLPLAYKILKDDRYIFVMVNDFNLIEALNEFIKAGFKFTKMIVWKKPNKVVNPFFMQQKEYIIFGRKGNTPRIKDNGSIGLIDIRDKDGNKITDIISTSPITKEDKVHNSQKPIELMEHLINTSTLENWVVFDPFMGSGSTGVACKNLNRKFLGIELEENYYNLAKQRIESEKNNGN